MYALNLCICVYRKYFAFDYYELRWYMVVKTLKYGHRFHFVIYHKKYNFKKITDLNDVYIVPFQSLLYTHYMGNKTWINTIKLIVISTRKNVWTFFIKFHDKP